MQRQLLLESLIFFAPSQLQLAAALCTPKIVICESPPGHEEAPILITLVYATLISKTAKV